jgi:hypothetical protein
VLPSPAQSPHPLIDRQFDENNSKIAELGDVQALVLIQDVGLWSGNRRKTEIAECREFLIEPSPLCLWLTQRQTCLYP